MTDHLVCQRHAVEGRGSDTSISAIGTTRSGTGTYALGYQRRNVLAESERPGPAVSAGRGHAWHRLTSPSLRPGKLRFGLMLHFVGSAKTSRAVLP